MLFCDQKPKRFIYKLNRFISISFICSIFNVSLLLLDAYTSIFNACLPRFWHSRPFLSQLICFDDIKRFLLTYFCCFLWFFNFSYFCFSLAFSLSACGHAICLWRLSCLSLFFQLYFTLIADLALICCRCRFNMPRGQLINAYAVSFVLISVSSKAYFCCVRKRKL